MRKTIKQLEEHIFYLEESLREARREVERVKAVNDAYKTISQHLPAATIALERITDAVAHVLGDLSKKWEGRK